MSSGRYLNKDWNNAKAWEERRYLNGLPEAIEPKEIEQVVELARDCEQLTDHYAGLKAAKKYFAKAAKQAHGDEEALITMYNVWNEYRGAITQRYLRLNEGALRAADAIAADVFDSFLGGIPKDRITYSKGARPIVFGGTGGPRDYETWVHPYDLPFALIRMPRTAFNNVQRWMALPHEVGHSLWVSIPDLAEEFEDALHKHMRKAVKDGEIKLAPVLVELPGFSVEYSPEVFVSKLWRNWACEAFCDMVAILSCGGAAVVEQQHVLDWGHRSRWFPLEYYGSDIPGCPDEHPVGRVRQYFVISVLRALGGDDKSAHKSLTDDLDRRFTRVAPRERPNVWYSDAGGEDLFTTDPKPLLLSADIAAKFLVDEPFDALGGNSCRDILCFTVKDQKRVDDVIPRLRKRDRAVTLSGGTTPRHVLAAAVLAFEQSPTDADTIDHALIDCLA